MGNVKEPILSFAEVADHVSSPLVFINKLLANAYSKSASYMYGDNRYLHIVTSQISNLDEVAVVFDGKARQGITLEFLKFMAKHFDVAPVRAYCFQRMIVEGVEHYAKFDLLENGDVLEAAKEIKKTEGSVVLVFEKAAAIQSVLAKRDLDERVYSDDARVPHRFVKRKFLQAMKHKL